MTFQQELDSWKFPMSTTIAGVPEIGSPAPSTKALTLPQPNGKPSVITFLRHCGCPFAEKTFKTMREAAEAHTEIQFTAVSQSDKSSTDKWLESVGGAGQIDVVVDDKRELFASWGLGISSFWHVLNPWSLWSVYKLGRSEDIWNRPTESGTRWQTAGTFAASAIGNITWAKVSATADDMPDFDEAIKSTKS